jgi:hypothetical protein
MGATNMTHIKNKSFDYTKKIKEREKVSKKLNIFSNNVFKTLPTLINHMQKVVMSNVAKLRQAFLGGCQMWQNCVAHIARMYTW